MTKNDLVNAVATHGLSKRQSSSVVESVFDIIFHCFEKGEDVKIVGFGHFRIRRKASRRGRNPQTGDSRSRSRRARCSRSSRARGSSNGSTTRPHERRLPSRAAQSQRKSSTTASARSRHHGVPAYVLRYWESEFKLLRPKKNPAGQRLYRHARPRARPAHQDPALRRAADAGRRQEAAARRVAQGARPARARHEGGGRTRQRCGASATTSRARGAQAVRGARGCGS